MFKRRRRRGISCTHAPEMPAKEKVSVQLSF